MKKTLVLLGIASVILIGTSCVHAEVLQADSRIAQVTVYPDSALITRAATLKLTPGKHTAIFSNIIPQVDEDSLRVSAHNNPQIKLFGAQFKKEFLKEVPSEREQQLRDQIQKAQDERKGLEDIKIALSEEKNFLDSVRLFSTDQIPKDLATRMPLAKDLEDTLKLLDTKLKELFIAMQDTEIKVRELLKKIDVLNRELAQISGHQQKLVRSVEITLEASRAVSVELSVSYRVFQASWQPIYDARADFEKSEVELVSYGLITQRTGEDWQDVQMSLSTAKPAIGGNLPYAAPWFIRPYQPPMVKEDRQLGFRAKKSQMMVQTMALDEKTGEAFSADAEGIEKEEYAKAEEKGIAVVYTLPAAVTVKSDGSEHKLPVSTQMLKANFKYSAYPRLSTYAYLGSRVTNAPGLQLLAGKVNIFLDGDFVGSSSITNLGPSEEFDLYLGIDESVKVKREEIEKKVDDVLIAGIPAPNKKITYKYKMSIENYKSKKTSVILFEAIPVSQDERIRVKVLDATMQPKDKDWKDRKGIWRWEMELEPKQKKEIIYSYFVEFPRDMQVEGL